MKQKTIYIAGAMRGLPRFNFDAFNSADKDLTTQGWKTFSPAKIDEGEGFDPDTDSPDESFLKRVMQRNLALIFRVDALALLPGWEKSEGVAAELSLARYLGIPIYLYPSMVLIEDECILEEAMRITSGDRQNQYGAADQDFARTAQMWSALKGVEFTTEEVAAFQICVKLSRNTHQSKRDNWVDVAGYSKCGHNCATIAEKRQREGSQGNEE
jgi:hypothetical protein